MRDTIKKHSDFLMPADTPSAVMPAFIAKCRPTKFAPDARYGLVASKKTFKLAVDRNRAKRLLRVWIRENETLLKPDFDYVFIARAPILETVDGTGMMAKALKKI